MLKTNVLQTFIKIKVCCFVLGLGLLVSCNCLHGRSVGGIVCWLVVVGCLVVGWLIDWSVGCWIGLVFLKKMSARVNYWS